MTAIQFTYPLSAAKSEKEERSGSQDSIHLYKISWICVLFSHWEFLPSSKVRHLRLRSLLSRSQVSLSCVSCSALHFTVRRMTLLLFKGSGLPHGVCVLTVDPKSYGQKKILSTNLHRGAILPAFALCVCRDNSAPKKCEKIPILCTVQSKVPLPYLQSRIYPE